ncbi:unnamed protein product [Bemisia tabaci]|uniref:UDP-glucuronosyltransferase n=1 Tax=Bemisia tabaci TaxID=7038 RepID=A0A9P0A5B3_BEMTA|nr:unnamed protein product [Bemisia tabaci]
MLRNTSLFLLTSNPALRGAKLYPPNVIEISGIHFKDPAPLDEELNDIMDKAKKGVIYFSFGTLLKASNIRKEIAQTFLTVFGQLDQTILWKADLKYTDWDIPKNVYMRDRFDQISILAHPNCVLFLTHGGVSSMMEAIKNAIPVIVVPFFADQNINAANAQYLGYGLHLSYRNLTQQSLRWAITAVLRDSRFKASVERASEVFTDKPMSSLDSSVYWIEYVIRHSGAHHLKPPTVHMPWYQLFFLDVIVVYFVAFCLILYIFKQVISLLFLRLLFVTKSSKAKVN